MSNLQNIILSTQTAYRSVFLACWGSGLIKERLNHLGLALLPMTFCCMRHAMRQKHKNINPIMFFKLTNKRHYQRSDGWQARKC